jgi:hypothetical protein
LPAYCMTRRKSLKAADMLTAFATQNLELCGLTSTQTDA